MSIFTPSLHVFFSVFDFPVRSHVDIAESLGLVDFRWGLSHMMIM